MKKLAGPIAIIATLVDRDEIYTFLAFTRHPGDVPRELFLLNLMMNLPLSHTGLTQDILITATRAIVIRTESVIFRKMKRIRNLKS